MKLAKFISIILLTLVVCLIGFSPPDVQAKSMTLSVKNKKIVTVLPQHSADWQRAVNRSLWRRTVILNKRSRGQVKFLYEGKMVTAQIPRRTPEIVMLT